MARARLGASVVPSYDGGMNEEVCVPNISTAEQKKRLKRGALMVVLGLVILALLVTLDVTLWWRLLLFPLWFGAASGFFQARDKT